MKKYICECCGGQINPHTMKCEYCGTQYKREYDDRIIRFETFQNPVITLKAKVNVDSDIPLETASELAIRELTHKLAESIAPFLTIETSRNPHTMTHDICGMIKIIKPEK